MLSTFQIVEKCGFLNFLQFNLVVCCIHVGAQCLCFKNKFNCSRYAQGLIPTSSFQTLCRISKTLIKSFVNILQNHSLTRYLFLSFSRALSQFGVHEFFGPNFSPLLSVHTNGSQIELKSGLSPSPSWQPALHLSVANRPNTIHTLLSPVSCKIHNLSSRHKQLGTSSFC